MNVMPIVTLRQPARVQFLKAMVNVGILQMWLKLTGWKVRDIIVKCLTKKSAAVYAN